MLGSRTPVLFFKILVLELRIFVGGSFYGNGIEFGVVLLECEN